MKKELIDILLCPACEAQELTLNVESEDSREVRNGALKCSSCNRTFAISDGVADLLFNLPHDVVDEMQAFNNKEYILTLDRDIPVKITSDSLQRYKDVFLSFPSGDGSRMFSDGGAFQNQSENAERFFKTLEAMDIKGNETVLEIGAGFTWATNQFAKKGCRVVATDICNQLLAGDLFFAKDNTYYDRLLANMNKLPFKNETFDVIFANSALHHCVTLEDLYKELLRVLKKRGKLVAIAECALGRFENPDNIALSSVRNEGHQEQAFTLWEWKRAAKKAGFRKANIQLFSAISDYVDKKERRKQIKKFKYKLAKRIQGTIIEKMIFSSTNWYRWIFRPGSWKLECVK